MNKDEALEIALEALELHGKQYPHMVKGYCLDAITAIKKALETKDEPVYWEMPDGKIVDKWGLQFYRGDTGTPLYTHPKEWVGLTDEEQSFVYDQVKQTVGGKPFWVKFADAIEDKLKERNT